ncbi:homoaconitate hydratase family protein [Alkalicaulis satelles]|uniref:3-isopropylmalate dehydratase large subunit n=1 Tax=Alkalicaulis satelles TaxID=2609175 RepID=A0A5M6ZGT9_9PROT|nr:aconitase/3-isopropylmalate dehydratase large subunit family protein [Alkalicaulis satelles]KAA5803983.1 homoaconitate hydratase family protein [Alkalicaulis satelles]
MAATLVEKILARAAGRDAVSPGDIVTIGVDLAMAHDSSGPRRWQARLEALGARLWDPDRVVIVSDHYVPAVDAESAAILKQTRAFARDYGVKHFYDMKGICHVILPENGHVIPGMVIAGGDSHTTNAGAFGAYAAGFGATDMTAIAATGETWTTVPDTIRVEITGTLSDGVTAKDVMLALCRDLGMGNHFKAVEYDGEAVRAMDMEARMVLANMAAELGAETGLIAPDDVTLAHIRAHGGTVGDDAPDRWRSDGDAVFARTFKLDGAALAPQAAAPHSPANSADVGDHDGARIDQAYIGACVGAKLSDLRMAAAVLKGRKIAPGVRLLVAPASARVTAAAAKDGTLETLIEAGAVMLPSGCGACAGLGAGLLAAGEVCISSTNRNFKGRMGHKDASVYLGSPYTVAASAIEGRVADPRPFLTGRRAAA